MSPSNVKRFTARTSREALALARQAFGQDAVVLSTRPSEGGGVEVLAMAPDGISHIEKAAATAPVVRAEPAAAKPVPASAAEVQRDVAQLAMSTLSFQDYVRDRMLRRRQAQRDAAAAPRTEPAAEPVTAPTAPAVPAYAAPAYSAPAQPAPVFSAPARAVAEPPMLREPVQLADASLFAEPQDIALPSASQAGFRAAAEQAARADEAMMAELRSMKGLIEDRFGALAFMEKLHISPRRAALTQRLLDVGFSPMLVRKMAESLPADEGDENTWAAGVLERNLIAAEREPALEDAGGIYALVGATGVGKTTTTAKLAAAFATQHGSGNLGLITLDAYRVGAHEQLRTYGRILGVPVHTAHDRASLEDLLDLLSAKKPGADRHRRHGPARRTHPRTAGHGVAPRDPEAAGAQRRGPGRDHRGRAVRLAARPACGVVLSKIDEAVKLGPALDAADPPQAQGVGVANGQRVPEDWHRLSAQALVQRALRVQASASWKLDASEVNLVFASFGAGRAAAPLNA
jgi:flagellar biosynthesis protein FlhF